MRLRLWNEKVIDLGVNQKVTVTIPRISGLRYLLNPSLDNMRHAYVEKKIELKGTITDIVKVSSMLATNGSNTSVIRRAPRVLQHTQEINAHAIAYHYDVSKEFYTLWLDSNMVYSCGYSRSLGDRCEVIFEDHRNVTGFNALPLKRDHKYAS
jgi:cyclopropane-fatty-acyl-phospholipid synthase